MQTVLLSGVEVMIQEGLPLKPRKSVKTLEKAVVDGKAIIDCNRFYADTVILKAKIEGEKTSVNNYQLAFKEIEIHGYYPPSGNFILGVMFFKIYLTNLRFYKLKGLNVM